ncbi:MAG: hypothetical protein O2794_04440 [bacterium]|nr:hypothetical protein [bacterium]
MANVLWEQFHSRLYVHYKGGAITNRILTKAAFFDGFVTIIAGTLLYYVPPFEGRLWLVLLGLFIFAVGLEVFALITSRWQYKSSMPVLPILKVGLTPIVQLPLIGYIVFWLVETIL